MKIFCHFLWFPFSCQNFQVNLLHFLYRKPTCFAECACYFQYLNFLSTFLFSICFFWYFVVCPVSLYLYCFSSCFFCAGHCVWKSTFGNNLRAKMMLSLLTGEFICLPSVWVWWPFKMTLTQTYGIKYPEISRWKKTFWRLFQCWF